LPRFLITRRLLDHPAEGARMIRRQAKQAAPGR
jgi:hypothetical protein